MRYSERYMETLKKVTEQINFGDTLKDRSFLVTGATGMIGSAFTDMLLYLNREKQLNLHVFAAVRNVNRAEKMIRWVLGVPMSFRSFRTAQARK